VTAESKRFRGFLTLTLNERRVLLQAAVLLPLVAGSLRLIGFRSTRRCLRRFFAFDSFNQHRKQGDYKDALAVARLVGIAAWHTGFSKGSCLPRSVTLWSMLRQRGIESEVRIGVRKHGDGIEAHAWVVCCDAVLNDGRDVERTFPPLRRNEESFRE
jgi:hypothetical protein